MTAMLLPSAISVVLLLIAACAYGAEPPADAKSWWDHVRVMASDANEGRDTGSEGYRRAERYVIGQFEKLGLKPAGEKGYVQRVALHSVELDANKTTVELVRDGKAQRLRFLEEISLTAGTGLPQAIDGPVVLADQAGSDVRGKFVVVPSGGRQAGVAAALAKAGALGIINVDNPRATEPPRWPVAYAKIVRPARPAESSFFNIRVSEELAAKLLQSPASLRIRTQTVEKDLTSDNLIAALPGELDEYVVVSAHLDGYGIGYPVNGDKIYNGAFDDCAYVATLLEFASHLRRSGQKLKRGILFVVVTGEEKGLLGSAYFTAHPTIPKDKLVADLNLDYLRPIFPLRSLTVLALDQSTLGATAKRVAESMGIQAKPDDEPERGLFRRSDQFNFLKIGVPALAFIFGYDKGSAEEKTYRNWYMDRYHKPSDDLDQPIDFEAAMRFNQFFEKLAVEVANAAERPRMMGQVAAF